MNNTFIVFFMWNINRVYLHIYPVVIINNNEISA